MDPQPKGPQAARLRQRKFALIRQFQLPEDLLPGSLSVSLTRCGKPTCHCAKGEGHAAWSLTFMAAGKKRVERIPKDWVDDVRRRVEAGRAFQAPSKFTGPDDPVFCNRTGRPHTIANLNKRTLKPTAESLGMGWVSWHAFRRTHATLMDQANAAVADRIAQMGHSAFAMTLKYTSADIERRRGIVEQVSALVHGTGEREPSENQG